jgi:hypothetical protein
MAGHLMLHVTEHASAYMENLWLWVADHDIEDPKAKRLNIYVARGVLIESRGPSWIWGTSNEHSAFYQWELSGAKDIYLGHIQSETAYYQAGQSKATDLYVPGQTPGLPGDPKFNHCTEKTSNTAVDTCNEGWALRIVKGSSRIYIYGAGFYSFFQDYSTNCTNGGPNVTCQDRIIDIDFSGPIYMFNIYSVGAKEIVSPQGRDLEVHVTPRLNNLNGFSTATAAWVLSERGLQIGGTRGSFGTVKKYNPSEKSVMLCPGVEEIKTEDQWHTSELPSHCLAQPLMGACKDTLEKARDRHKEESYTQFYGAYREMRLDYFDNTTEIFVDEKMLRGDDYLKYFKCQWKAVNEAKATEIPCRTAESLKNELPFQSGSIAYKLEDEEGFYQELNKTYKLARGMITFDGSRIMLHSQDVLAPGSSFDENENPPRTDEGGMAKYELIGLPKGNRAFEVENPMPHFMNMTSLLAGESHNLLENHMREMDYSFDGAMDQDTAYSLCYVPTLLREMADQIDEIIRLGKEYEKEVLTPRHKRERERKIFDGIMMAVGIVFMVAGAMEGGGGALAAAARGPSVFEKGVVMVLPRFQGLFLEARDMAVQGGRIMADLGLTLQALSTGTLVTGGGSMAGIISKDFPDERGTVLSEFFLLLAFPIGSYALRSGRVSSAGDKGVGSAGRWKGFDMQADAGALSTEIKADLMRGNPAVREHMAKFENKLSPASAFCSGASGAVIVAG